MALETTWFGVSHPVKCDGGVTGVGRNDELPKYAGAHRQMIESIFCASAGQGQELRTTSMSDLVSIVMQSCVSNVVSTISPTFYGTSYVDL